MRDFQPENDFGMGAPEGYNWTRPSSSLFTSREGPRNSNIISSI